MDVTFGCFDCGRGHNCVGGVLVGSFTVYPSPASGCHHLGRWWRQILPLPSGISTADGALIQSYTATPSCDAASTVGIT